MKAQVIEIWVIALLMMIIIVVPILVRSSLLMPSTSKGLTYTPVIVRLKTLEINCTKSGMSVRVAVISNGNVDGTFIISGKPYDYIRVNVEGYSTEGYAPIVFKLHIKNGMKVINFKTNATEAVTIYSYYSYSGEVKGNVAQMISCLERPS